MNVDKIDDKNSVHHIVQLMANIINYLNVSLYQGQFTYNHEQSFTQLNELYVQLSKTHIYSSICWDNSWCCSDCRRNNIFNSMTPKTSAKCAIN